MHGLELGDNGSMISARIDPSRLSARSSSTPISREYRAAAVVRLSQIVGG